MLKDTDRERAQGAFDAVNISTCCRPCFNELSSLDMNVHMDTLGPAQGPTLLFVHGGASCRAMFRPHAEQLALSEYRCVLIDLRGTAVGRYCGFDVQ